MNLPSYYDNMYTGKRPGLIFYINEPGSQDIEPAETEESILFALENGITSFHASCDDRQGIQNLVSAMRKWDGNPPSVSLGIGEIETVPGSSRTNSLYKKGIGEITMEFLASTGIEKIDILVLNDPPLSDSHLLKGIFESLAGLRNKGLLGTAAIGCFNPEEYSTILGNNNFSFLWGTNRMNACNLDALQGDIQLATGAGLGYINSSVLHRSLLGDKLGQYSRERPGSILVSERDVSVAVMASRIASRNNMTVPEMSYRYALSMGDADMVVVSTGDRSHTEEVIYSIEKGPLSREIFDAINTNISIFYR